ncbi:MAG: hypothetical protein ACI9TZ_003033 [Yoonia sp.]
MGLTATASCVCTSKKLGCNLTRPLSSNCPIQFALAANVRSPPLVSSEQSTASVILSSEPPFATKRHFRVTSPKYGDGSLPDKVLQSNILRKFASIHSLPSENVD